MIPEGKEDGPIYPIFLTPSESEAPVLRYSDKHFQELLQEPHHIQLMELRASAIRWKIRLNISLLIKSGHTRHVKHVNMYKS